MGAGALVAVIQQLLECGDVKRALVHVLSIVEPC